MNPRFFWLLLVTLAVVLAADVFSRFVPAVGIVGSWGFVASGVLLLTDTVRRLVQSLRSGIERRWLALALAPMWTFVGIMAFYTVNLSPETAQQVGCGWQGLIVNASSSFQGTCFLGYPARQFFLGALPTLLFGPSVPALQLGGALYFFIGFTLWVTGLLSWLGNDRKAGVLTVVAVLFMLHCQWTLFSVSYFEQSHIPFSLSLAFVGLVLQFLRSNSRDDLLLMGAVLFHAVGSYTPGLSLVFAGLAFLSAIVFSGKYRRDHRQIAATLVVAVALELTVSALFRDDLLRLGQSQHVFLLSDTALVLRALIIPTDRYPLASEVGRFLVPATLLLVLSGRFGLGRWVAAFWFLVTVLAAGLLTGYSQWPVAIRLQRVMVAFPVVPVLFVDLLRRLRTWPGDKDGVTAAMVVLAVTGVWFQQGLLRRRIANTAGPVAEWVRTVPVPIDSSQSETLELEPDLNEFRASLGDFLIYFRPNWYVPRGLPTCESLATAKLVLTTRDGQCEELRSSLTTLASFEHEGKTYRLRQRAAK